MSADIPTFKENKDMKIYKLSKKPLVLLYVLLAAVLLLIEFALNMVLALIDRFVPGFHGFADYYVLLPVWVMASLFAVLVLPFYFHKAG